MNTVAVALVLGTAAAIGAPAADATVTPSTTELTEATRTIHALTASTGSDALRSIPSEFGATFYSPTIEGGVLVNPAGDCSSPVPLPSEFDAACRAHDLGYDLIRFGDLSGSPTSPQSRKELDRRFGETIRSSCEERTGIGSRTACYVMSEVASASVRFNSWRQHYGTPESEPALPFLLTALFGTAIGSAVLAVKTLSATRRAAAIV